MIPKSTRQSKSIEVNYHVAGLILILIAYGSLFKFILGPTNSERNWGSVLAPFSVAFQCMNEPYQINCLCHRLFTFFGRVSQQAVKN